MRVKLNIMDLAVSRLLLELTCNCECAFVWLDAELQSRIDQFFPDEMPRRPRHSYLATHMA